MIFDVSPRKLYRHSVPPCFNSVLITAVPWNNQPCDLQGEEDNTEGVFHTFGLNILILGVL